MIITRLAEQVEESPEAAQIAFDRLDGALNMILPDGDTHRRYWENGSIGLAAVIARDHIEPGTYNPLLADVLDNVSFYADNRAFYPQAWDNKENDAKTLGGEVPNSLGRFGSFALAKINNLTYETLASTSFNRQGDIVEPGRVGFAGGQRRFDSLFAISGLWGIHDHAAGIILAHEIVLENAPEIDTIDRTSDDLADDIEPIFDHITSLHEGTAADKLSRMDIAKLIPQVTGVVLETLKYRTARDYRLV